MHIYTDDSALPVYVFVYVSTCPRTCFLFGRCLLLGLFISYTSIHIFWSIICDHQNFIFAQSMYIYYIYTQKLNGVRSIHALKMIQTRLGISKCFFSTRNQLVGLAFFDKKCSSKHTRRLYGWMVTPPIAGAVSKECLEQFSGHCQAQTWDMGHLKEKPVKPAWIRYFGRHFCLRKHR